jgi:hypothetical protein
MVKEVRAKMLIETEEQLFYNKINLYDNVNTKKDILKHLDSIKVLLKNIIIKVKFIN